MPTLEDIPIRTSSTITRHAIAGINLSQREISLSFTVTEFLENSVVHSEENIASTPKLSRAKIAQRNLDPAHVKRLARYIIKGLASRATKSSDLGKGAIDYGKRVLEFIGDQPYFALQPFVACLSDQTVTFKYAEIPGFKNICEGTMQRKKNIEIIDGNHRREALGQVRDWLRAVVDNRDYPKRGPIQPKSLPPFGNDIAAYEFWENVDQLLDHVCVSCVVHVNISPEQQRQLFHDLNNLSKRVDKDTAYRFDNSNAVNLYVKELTESKSRSVTLKPAIHSKDITDWHKDTGVIARKDVLTASSLVMTGKTSNKTAEPRIVEERAELADDFWEMYNSLDGIGEPQAKLRNVAAQPALLKALARLTYEVAYNKTDGDEKDAKRLLKRIPKIVDFSHENPYWDIYNTGESLRAKMKNYLPTEEGVNRDIGQRDADGKMRFGAKHNDISPILVDILRYQLELPPKKRRNKKK